MQAAIEPAAIERVCAAIVDEGLCVVPDFLPVCDIAALAADARRRDDAGLLRAAGIGRGIQRNERTQTRGDRITWLDDADPTPALQCARAALEGLRCAFNASLFLGLVGFEAHYALYPAGAIYARHRDRFRDDDARVISCVLYLNEGWQASDGGALRIHMPEGGWRDVIPLAGTLVVFLSERFVHEVLAATRSRLALTGWFRRRPLESLDTDER
jgi:SM-20-related protein